MLAKFISSDKVIFTRPKVPEGLGKRDATDEEMRAMGYKPFIESIEPTDGRNWDCIYMDGESITQKFELSKEQPSAEEIRKRNYEMCKCIEYKGQLLSVDSANRLVMQYSCEGVDMTELKALIHERKQVVREQFKEVEK